jgi:hypothetical protein
MIAVVVAVVRSGHAFSGGATQMLRATWGADVTGRRGPSVTAP